MSGAQLVSLSRRHEVTTLVWVVRSLPKWPKRSFSPSASLLHIPVSQNPSPGTTTPIENPRILSPAVAADVEKAVTFFSKNPQPRTGPSLQASLDRLSIDVTPELTLEVLKRLGNAASLTVSFFRWSEK